VCSGAWCADIGEGSHRPQKPLQDGGHMASVVLRDLWWLDRK